MNPKHKKLQESLALHSVKWEEATDLLVKSIRKGDQKTKKLAWQQFRNASHQYRSTQQQLKALEKEEEIQITRKTEWAFLLVGLILGGLLKLVASFFTSAP